MTIRDNKHVIRSSLWRRMSGEETKPKSGRYLKVPIPVDGIVDKCPECGLWPFIDWGSEFKPACEWHDRMYLKKEFDQLPEDYTREKVDMMFFKQCLAIADNDPALVEKAAVYYILVRLFGGFVW